MRDLLKFTFKPVDSENWFSKDLRKWSCLGSPSKKISVSSAYCKMGKSAKLGRGIGSFRSAINFAFVNHGLGQICSQNKEEGDRSPCLTTTLLQWNVFPGTSLRSTIEVAIERISLIYPAYPFLTNAPSFKNRRIAWCSTLSKAFSKSSFKMTIPFLEWWHKCKYSKAQSTQSWIVLDLLNPHWFLCINFIISLYNLIASNFVISLRD